MIRLDNYGDEIAELYQHLEDELFEIIVRRLKPSDPEMNVLAWQVEKMAQLGMLNKETIARISKRTGVAPEAVENVIRKAGEDTIYDTDKYIKGKEIAPIDNVIVSRIETMVGLAQERFNLINQHLMTNNGIQAKFLDVVNKVTAEVLGGQTTLNDAILKTVNQWSDMGLSSPFVDSAGRRWSLERYVKTAVKTTVNNVNNEVREQRMADYDLHTVEVSYKPNARKACSKIQGHIVDLRRPSELPAGWKFKSIYDDYWQAHYKEPAGCRGINCHHQLRPFDPELEEPTPMAEKRKQASFVSPDEARKNEEINQAFRRRELAMNRTREHMRNAKALGDTDKVNAYKKLLANQRANMVNYVRQNESKLRLFRNRDVDKFLK